MKQEITGLWDGSGISWTICKQSAPHSRQITTTTPHHSIFTGRMLSLTPSQQCQITEGKSTEGNDYIWQLVILNTVQETEKLLEHAMKVIERIFEHRIRQQIKIDDMQFGFMKGKGTTDAIFMARQMQENYNTTCMQIRPILPSFFKLIKRL